MRESLQLQPPPDDTDDHHGADGPCRDDDGDLIDLASSDVGAVVLFATDEWFAIADNLLNPLPPAFDPDAYCAEGKVMDGWESRRRRIVGHDWCVIALGGYRDRRRRGDHHHDHHHDDDDQCGALISRIELDTAHFTGNQAPRVSVEAMRVARPHSPDKNNDVNVVDDDDYDDDDYLYTWMPGAATRLARGGGERGTSRSSAAVARALDACRRVARVADPDNVEGEWIEVIPTSPLDPGNEGTRYHSFAISDEAAERMEKIGGVTHLRLNYYPDGGVARMRVYGRPLRRVVVESGGRRGGTSSTALPGDGTTPGRTIVGHDTSMPLPSARPHPTPELSSELNGGIGLACSNAHYGEPGELLRAEPGTSMKDGWETARHPDRPHVVVRDPTTGLQETSLSDWCVIRLGLGGAVGGTVGGIVGAGPGGVDRIVVDTRHFKGNFPESVAIDGCRIVDSADGSSDERVRESAAAGKGGRGVGGIEWFPLLKRTPMTAHAEHEYTTEGHYLVNSHRSVTHVRVTITPDGGLSRVRIYGSPAADDAPRCSSKL